MHAKAVHCHSALRSRWEREDEEERQDPASMGNVARTPQTWAIMGLLPFSALLVRFVLNTAFMFAFISFSWSSHRVPESLGVHYWMVMWNGFDGYLIRRNYKRVRSWSWNWVGCLRCWERRREMRLWIDLLLGKGYFPSIVLFFFSLFDFLPSHLWIESGFMVMGNMLCIHL